MNTHYLSNALYRSLKRTYESTVNVYTPDYVDGKSVMLLAMHWAPDARVLESDTVRIDEFRKHGWGVCSVDLWNHRDTEGHVSMNFYTERSIKRLVAQYPSPDLVILDYFWLQENYYEERYGENWPQKALLLFQGFPNLRMILLPIDDPSSRSSSMEEQTLKMRERNMNVFILSADDDLNPLVRYTKQVDDALRQIDAGRTHDAQEFRMSGYVVIVRPGLDESTARAWLEWSTS